MTDYNIDDDTRSSDDMDDTIVEVADEYPLDNWSVMTDYRLSNLGRR